MLNETEKVQIEELKKQLDRKAKALSLGFDVSQSRRGEVYSFHPQSCTLDITLGEEWVGYELTVPTSEMGENYTIGEDTDNYKLDGDNSEVTLAIFKEGLRLLDILTHDTLYTGHRGKRAFLAIPNDDKTYTMREKRWSLGWQYEISKDELMRIPGVRPIT